LLIAKCARVKLDGHNRQNTLDGKIDGFSKRDDSEARRRARGPRYMYQKDAQFVSKEGGSSWRAGARGHRLCPNLNFERKRKKESKR